MAAMINPQIKAHMIDAVEFPELSEHYSVSSVPQTVVDGARTITFIGRYPEGRFLDELRKAL